MRNLISENVGARIMLVIFTCTIIFHFLVLGGIVPYDMVWGGRLKNNEEMVRFEWVSILVNFVMLFVVLLAARVIPNNVPSIIFQVAFWMMAVLFLMNTVGNLLSNSAMEKAIFTPITALLALCSLRLALAGKKQSARFSPLNSKF